MATAIVITICLLLGLVLFCAYPIVLDRSTRRCAEITLLAGLMLMFGSFMAAVIATAVNHA